MTASDDDPSGGILRGHGIAFALAAIFGGIALVVAYAASDGAIFGISDDSRTDAELPTEGQEAAIISRDSFDDAESTSPPPNTANPLPETGSTLSEEQRQLLAMRDFPWNSVAGRHIASNQDLMDKFREPVSVQSGAEPLLMSDSVQITISRERTIDEEELDDIIDIPVELGDEEEPEEAEHEDEEETPQDDEDQSDDNPPTEEPTDDSGSGDNSGPGGGDNSSGSGDGNSGSGNSTDSEGPSEDSGSGSADDNNSTAAEIIIS